MTASQKCMMSLYSASFPLLMQPTVAESSENWMRAGCEVSHYFQRLTTEREKYVNENNSVVNLAALKHRICDHRAGGGSNETFCLPPSLSLSL